VRVRAGWVTDADIRAMTALMTPAPSLQAIEGGEAA